MRYELSDFERSPAAPAANKSRGVRRNDRRVLTGIFGSVQAHHGADSLSFGGGPDEPSWHNCRPVAKVRSMDRLWLTCRRP